MICIFRPQCIVADAHVCKKKLIRKMRIHYDRIATPRLAWMCRARYRGVSLFCPGYANFALSERKKSGIQRLFCVPDRCLSPLWKRGHPPIAASYPETRNKCSWRGGEGGGWSIIGDDIQTLTGPAGACRVPHAVQYLF